MSFGVYLFLQGVIRKYGEKAHMSGLQRDNYVPYIFLNLEESRSHGNKRQAERAQGHGARPTPLGARPPGGANQAPSPGSCPTAFNLQE